MWLHVLRKCVIDVMQEVINMTTYVGECVTDLIAYVGECVTDVIACVGLWMADLVVTQLLQETVRERERGIVSGVQHSLNMLMDVLKFTLVIILPYIETFGYLIILSFIFICLASISFAVYAHSVLHEAKVEGWEANVDSHGADMDGQGANLDGHGTSVGDLSGDNTWEEQADLSKYIN